ncbi:hypothetical protein ACIQFU_23060 [Streptomyces sp. NPDC093065]|uniref:hypothetical protein n=1 Tax=Streptomyces sp. NPDC093065 TaxID=3366021 RepID=UPI0037FD6893
MSKQQTGTIYTLADPRDSSIRYVGQTKQDPLERLAGHLASASNPAMRVWLNALALQGLTPRIEAIATPLIDRLDDEEQRQIQHHADAGHRLFNAPHYHRHIADLYKAAAPAPAVLKRDDVAAGKVDEYAHRVYGDIAAARVAGKLTRGQAITKVLLRVPGVVAVFVWHTLASLTPMRWAAQSALAGWALWVIGFDHLVQDKVLPHLPIEQASEFWHEYLQRPAINLVLLYLAGSVLAALAAYSSVRQSAEAQPRTTSPLHDDLVAAAARALDAAAPRQPEG